MAHTIGSAISPNDLLDQLRIWLLIRGWTTDLYASVGYGYRLHMHKGSIYVNLCSFLGGEVGFAGNYQGGTGIALTLGSGFDAGSDFAGQPGIPIWGMGTMGSAMLLHAGPFISHQFFDDEAGNILVMVERNPGAWRHLCWGDSLDKAGAGAWTGGQYFSANFGSAALNAGDSGNVYSDVPPMNNYDVNSPSAWVRADVDTYQGKWLNLSRYEETSTSEERKGATNAFRSWQYDEYSTSWGTVPRYGLAIRNRLYNIQDSRAILLPMMIYAHRDQGGASFLGTVPSIYLSAARGHGIADGQDLVIGSDTYRQFSGFFVRKVAG